MYLCIYEQDMDLDKHRNNLQYWMELIFCLFICLLFFTCSAFLPTPITAPARLPEVQQ